MDESSKRFEEIRKKVEEKNGVLTLTMVELRDAQGALRLGALVLEGISKNLSGVGLGHYPEELPNNQISSVRIYKLGSAVSDIITAVLKVNEENDAKLREKANNEDSALLRQVREMVCG